MEYPKNINFTLEAEERLRQAGGIPATIAIIMQNQKLYKIKKVGIAKEEVGYLGKKGRKCKKCSRQDLAVCLFQKLNGSTSHEICLIYWYQNLVTDGIGGVHRGYETTFNISANLKEQGGTQVDFYIINAMKIKVAVISANAKSILDIPKTLEYLETEEFLSWDIKLKFS